MIVGLSPVFLLGGFYVSETVASHDTPLFAGSAIIAQEARATEVATPAPAPSQPTLAVEDDDEIGMASTSVREDSVEHVVLTRLASPQPEAQTAQLGNADAAAPVDGEMPVDGEVPVLRKVPDIVAPERTHDGWRVAPQDGLAEIEDPATAPATVEQPRWQENAEDQSGARFIPVPPRKPERLRADVTAPATPVSTVTPADRAPATQQTARVVIHHGSPTAASAARGLAATLSRSGLGQAEFRGVGVPVSQANVRYFHQRDRAAAAAVDQMLRRNGYESQLRDFTHFTPAPSSGTVEVWLPG